MKKRIKQPYHIPIAWCKEYGDGKVFHMSLGHNEAVWEDPRYRDSILGGIKWILGQEPGDATPNPEVSAGGIEKGERRRGRRKRLSCRHNKALRPRLTEAINHFD